MESEEKEFVFAVNLPKVTDKGFMLRQRKIANMLKDIEEAKTEGDALDTLEILRKFVYSYITWEGDMEQDEAYELIDKNLTEEQWNSVLDGLRGGN